MGMLDWFRGEPSPNDIEGVPIEGRSLSYQDLWSAGGPWNGTGTQAGVDVSDSSALAMSAVYGCVRILTDSVSTLPVEARRGVGLAAPAAIRQPVWLYKPSLRIGKIDTWAQIMTSLLLRGNAYLYTVRDPMGMVKEIIPLDPDSVSPTDTQLTSWDGRYNVGHDLGGLTLGPLDVLHIRNMSLPGRTEGMSPLTYARETIGLGLAAQQYGSTHFGNGAVPGAVVETEAEMSMAAIRTWKAEFNELHQGAGNAHKLAVFGGGATYRPISISPVDSQFLETRQFQTQDVARFYGVPSHLLNDASNSTSWGSGLAEQGSAFKELSLRSWVERMEEGFSWLAQTERPTVNPNDRMVVTIMMDQLLRGDFASQVDAIVKLRASKILTMDECRAYIGYGPGPDELDEEIDKVLLQEAMKPKAKAKADDKEGQPSDV